MQINSLTIIKVYKKFLYIIFYSLLFFIFSFSILDSTKDPIKVDLIVSLGGDNDLERISKATMLYKKGFSLTNKILITGYNEEYKYKDLSKIIRLNYLLKNGINSKNIFLAFNTKNTIMELDYILDFLTKNNLKSAIIVTDTPHSKRIDLLLKILDSDNKFKIIVVRSNASWWENKFNAKSLNFIFSEYIKIPYSLLKVFFHQS